MVLDMELNHVKVSKNKSLVCSGSVMLALTGKDGMSSMTSLTIQSKYIC